MGVLDRILRAGEGKKVKALAGIVPEVNALGPSIAALSDDHRQIILLKEVEGLSYQEMAEVIGCSIGTVMSRLFYARKSLQNMLHDLHPSR